LAKKDVSPLEFELMEVLWRKGEATAKEIQTALAPERPLAQTTVATLLMRMTQKGCIAYREGNSARMYRPLVPRDQVVRRKLDDLVQTVLGGDISPLVSYIAEHHRLTPEQIGSLKSILKSGKEE